MQPMTPTSRSSVKRARSLLLAAVPVASFLLAAPSTSRALDLLNPAAGGEINSIFDKAKASVVQVRSGDKGFILAGSGFFIDDQGTIITSSTILGENTTARVVINGVEMDAKIIGNDPRSGLAMLRVAFDDSPPLPMGHATDLKTGDGVLMIGFPMNLAVAPSQGPVSGFDTSYLARVDKGTSSEKESMAAVERFATSHIHANISISPGQVGGPLLNPRGEVVGLVATSPDDGQSIYALPVEAMQKIIGDFNLYGHARHGWVGVNVMAAPDNEHDGRTVRVVQVVSGTPASKSGILSGDTVMRIDTREIYRPADVLDASFFSHVGGSMTVVVRRDQKLYEYSFAVIERPVNTSTTPAVTSSSNPDSSSVGRPIVVNQVTPTHHRL